LDFIIGNVVSLTAISIPLLQIVLPLGISFFTFTQIAYLADAYHEKVKEYDFLNYCLFVTFFPHLLAGPIIHHKEMMPQFAQLKNKIFNASNFSMGVLLFSAGLAKKLVIADTLAVWANKGFNTAESLTIVEAWATSLSYTFQIYFDFSGYTDMALGSALLFNIRLPINFNSPYKALEIQDFWRRWHITLSRFLRDYVYIPIGGSRVPERRIYANLLITFLIGGLWHGAGWTFVLWGFIHGAGIVVHRAWKGLHVYLPDIAAWFLTFNFVNLAWIFFRAKSVDDALRIIKGMLGMTGVLLPNQILSFFPLLKPFFQGTGTMKNLGDGSIMGFVEMLLFLIMVSVVVFLMRNTNQMSRKELLVAFSLTFAFSMQRLFFSQVASEFIYFRF